MASGGYVFRFRFRSTSAWLGGLRFQVSVSVSGFAFTCFASRPQRGYQRQPASRAYSALWIIWDELGQRPNYVNFVGGPPHKSVPQGLRQSRNLHREHLANLRNVAVLLRTVIRSPPRFAYFFFTGPSFVVLCHFSATYYGVRHARPKFLTGCRGFSPFVVCYG